MDMSWQALLQEATAISFKKAADALAAENDGRACVDLQQSQLHELSEKILSLPNQGFTLLLGRYCFSLSPDEAEMFFHLENAKGHFRFYKELLSLSMGMETGSMISDDAFGKACHIALKKYLHNELEVENTASENSRTHKVLRKVWKTAAIAAVTAALLFSTCMAANAQFRERVISWVIETFEEYSSFELHGGETQDLTAYRVSYLPDGAVLKDTIKQPELIVYEYAVGEEVYLHIILCQSDNRVYLDTEDTEIEKIDKGGVTGYFFKRNNVSYICFERDGCFFTVFGSIDDDELLKVAAGIEKK